MQALLDSIFHVDEKRGGYDMIASSIGGFMSITGDPEKPSRPGVAITDISMALYRVRTSKYLYYYNSE